MDVRRAHAGFFKRLGGGPQTGRMGEIYLSATQRLDGLAGAQHAHCGALDLGGDLRCDYQQRTTTLRDYAAGGTRAGAYTG